MLGTASRSSATTSRPRATETPRSPVRIRPSQVTYWIGSGLSNPYAFLRSWTISSGASGGTTALRGSPGDMCTRAKTRIVTPSPIGMT